MNSVIKLGIFFVMLVAMFIGCGSDNRRQQMLEVPDDYKKIDINKIQRERSKHRIQIHGFKGDYPKTYKDVKLGDGLFNAKFQQIVQKIKDNLDEQIGNREILMKLILDSKNSKIFKLKKEAVRYFNNKVSFLRIAGKREYRKPDILLRIDNSEESLKFIIRYISKIFIKRKDIIDVGMSLDEFIAESTANWSTIKIRNNEGKIIVYKIMKNPVTIHDFDNRKSSKRPISGVDFNTADEYCYERYKGSISSLYVFEYALRNGAIKPPTLYGVSKEMVAGYDDGNEEDVLLKRDGDIVKFYNNDQSSSYDNILIFNYRTKSYEFKTDVFKSQSVTFRCIK